MAKEASRLDSARVNAQKQFNAIGAALADVDPGSLGSLKRGRINADRKLASRYENRVHALVLFVAHLRDVARRLAKQLGRDSLIVEEFVNTSQDLRLCVRVAESRKHGLGGRARNAAVLNGILTVVRTRQGQSPSDDDDEFPMGMLIADAELGVFHSRPVVIGALRSWIDFFKKELDLDLLDWEEQNLPSREKPTVHLDVPGKAVPRGTVVTMDLPEEVVDGWLRDVRDRVRAS